MTRGLHGPRPAAPAAQGRPRTGAAAAFGAPSRSHGGVAPGSGRRRPSPTPPPARRPQGYIFCFSSSYSTSTSWMTFLCRSLLSSWISLKTTNRRQQPHREKGRRLVCSRRPAPSAWEEEPACPPGAVQRTRRALRRAGAGRTSRGSPASPPTEQAPPREQPGLPESAGFNRDTTIRKLSKRFTNVLHEGPRHAAQGRQVRCGVRPATCRSQGAAPWATQQPFRASPEQQSPRHRATAGPAP